MTQINKGTRFTLPLFLLFLSGGTLPSHPHIKKKHGTYRNACK